MTKYVLNSGGMSNNPDGARQFIAELVSGLGPRPKLLMCFFAQPREAWEEKFPEYQVAFNQLMPGGLVPEYEMAFPETFAEQVNRNSVIYCHGGDDHLAMYWFNELGVQEIWKDKVVGTNSATTHALATHFWTCDWRMLKDGLGILPIKTLAHYKSDYGKGDPRGPIDWDEAKKLLENYGDTSIPVYALPEGEFIVIQQ